MNIEHEDDDEFTIDKFIQYGFLKRFKDSISRILNQPISKNSTSKLIKLEILIIGMRHNKLKPNSKSEFYEQCLHY